jgi:hypothetical protein
MLGKWVNYVVRLRLSRDQARGSVTVTNSGVRRGRVAARAVLGPNVTNFNRQK